MLMDGWMDGWKEREGRECGLEEGDPGAQELGPKAVATVQLGDDEGLSYKGTGHRNKAEGGRN